MLISATNIQIKRKSRWIWRRSTENYFWNTSPR